MNRPYILFVSNTTGFRVGKIMHGVLQECRRAKVGLLWRESDRLQEVTLSQPPIGVIIRDKLASIESVVRRWKKTGPVVSTIGHSLELPIHSVVPDPVGIARLVAAHLTAEGLRNFAFVGARNNPAARLRAQFFEAELRRLLGGEVPFAFFDSDLGDRFWGADTDRGRAFIELVRRSPMPLGVLTLTDQIAASCMECAEAAGIRVPQGMSIVGVDDHPIFSQMYQPLSSVRIDYEAIGRKAVELVLQLKAERTTQKTPVHHFVGGELIVRQSSQPRLHGDEHIAKALRHLHENFGSAVTLQELARMTGMSRTSFATRFRQAVGEAPIRYLIHLRLNQAKLQLAETSYSVSEIAYRVGFEDQGYFTRAFKKLCGTTPTEYRRQHAKPAAARR